MIDLPVLHESDFDQVQRILDGDARAWNRFVDDQSDRVWRKSWHLCSEACPYKHRRSSVFCVFHALAADGVQPATDQRQGCDEGLEIYAFIFDYLFNRHKNTGKLKAYDGRSTLDTFVSSSLGRNMRTDWIRHKRQLRVDQITYPEEIQRLSKLDQKVYREMVLHRATETIARNLDRSIEQVEQAQERVTHALIANGNLHLILRNPENGSLELVRHEDDDQAPHVLSMERVVDRLWERVCYLIGELPDNEKILLDMAFSDELDARTILERCETLGLELPVTPRTGNVTIHTIYQSIDAVLKRLGDLLVERFPDVMEDARDWLGEDDDQALSVSAKGLKVLLKTMGLTHSEDAAHRLSAASGASR